MATPKVTRKWIELEYSTSGALRAQDIYVNDLTSLEFATTAPGFPPMSGNIATWSIGNNRELDDSGVSINDTGTLTTSHNSIPTDWTIINTLNGGDVFIPIVGSTIIAGDLTPVAPSVHSLGEQGLEWKNLFVENIHVENITATSAVILHTEQIALSANYLELNSNETGTPFENAGVMVNRGTSSNSVLNWNETTDKWEAGISGSLDTIVLSSDSRLSDDRNPTNHGFAGGDHSISTIAQVNSKISDATLIDTNDSRLNKIQVDYYIAGTYGNGVDQTLLINDMNTYNIWSLDNAKLISVKAIHKTVDSGVEPLININLNGTNGLTSNLQLGSSGVWVSSTAVATHTISTGDYIDISCKTAGGSGDASDLTVSCIFEYV